MIRDEDERIATFASYVPQAVLRRLASIPSVPDEPHADRYPAALLLVDISGFTALTAAAVQRGPAGTEQLSRSLNAYLGQIIDLIAEHGGDISKIVGDALLPVWPAVDEDLAMATRRAAMCGQAIATRFGEFEVEGDLRLSLKIGLCAGEVEATHVGGLDGRWLFLFAGEGVSQLAEVERQMRTGDVVASPEAWALVSGQFVGRPLDRGHVRLGATQGAVAPRPLPPIVLLPEQAPSVRAYIPEVCLARLDAGQADWLTELRRTTVVFVNVRDHGAAKPDPVPLLQRITLAAQRAVARYGGWLKEITMDDKGTTLVAAFGVPPVTHEDDPARAVQAALLIQSEIRQLGLSAGVGAATGPALCGPVGNAKRRDFAVLGQHVNLASRLMQASGDEGILCDAATHEAARGRQTFERLPAYVLKGMATPIDVYRVRAAHPSADRPSGLIDRRDEMAVAVTALDDLRAGTGSLVVVEGEPGIGKSRFIDELVVQARRAGIDAFVGVADEIESSTPYHAWRGVFERLLGLEGVTDRPSRATRLFERLGSDEESSSLAPLLDGVLSLDLHDNEVTSQMSGAVRADNTNNLLVRLLRAATSSGSTMIVLEDAHWLDSSSWSLVLRVNRELPSLLLVATMRQVSDSASDPIRALRTEATMLRLGPLSRDDMIALACERTGANRIAESVAAMVQERAEGNPLFIEQLTYSMRDSGRIVVENGLCRAAGGEDLQSAIIPDTVQRVIVTRLDQLPPAEALTLKVASVIGQRFALRTLSDIYPLPIEPATLVDHLVALTRLDLIAPTPSAPEPAYAFRHVITQEVAYNLMLSAQSRELHRSLAEWYERTNATDLSPFHAFLAHHWRKAGDASRAVDHLELAGEQALRTFANEEAIGFLEAALALDAEAGLGLDADRRARWQLQLGEAYVHMSKYHEGRAHLEAGLRLMKKAPPASTWHRVTSLIGELLRQLLHRAGLSRGVRTLTETERTEFVAVCRAYERLAEASYYGRETLVPLYCVIRILNEAESSGIPAEIARGYAGTGALFGIVPLPRIASWYLRRALELIPEVEDLTTHEIVEIVAGFYYLGAGLWDPAREQFRAVRRIARRLGDRRRLDDALANLAELEYLQGSFRIAADLARELTTSARDRNDRRFEAEGLAAYVYSTWQLGDTEETVRSLASLKTMVAEEADLTDELKIKYSGLQALIQLSRGDRQQALAASEEAMKLTAHTRPTYYGTFLGYAGAAEVFLDLWESGQPVRDAEGRTADALSRLKQFAGVFPIGQPRSATLEGRRHWQLGRRDAALRSWEHAIAHAEGLSMAYEQGLAHYEIGRHLDLGDGNRAAHLEQAREIFRRLEASPALAAVEAVSIRDARST